MWKLKSMQIFQEIVFKPKFDSADESNFLTLIINSSKNLKHPSSSINSFSMFIFDYCLFSIYSSMVFWNISQYALRFKYILTIIPYNVVNKTYFNSNNFVLMKKYFRKCWNASYQVIWVFDFSDDFQFHYLGFFKNYLD